MFYIYGTATLIKCEQGSVSQNPSVSLLHELLHVEISFPLLFAM